ncbi:exo-alpha-sialidase [candidate division KSB1 bacterium]|nr:exo-alpha-sialidase [candidate division KSB1 bacterium]
MHKLFSCITLAAALMLSGGCAQRPKTYEQLPVFIGGTEGYDTFRIPALITAPSGDLLAICEGRKKDRTDSGDIDLVMKRSFDHGESWSDLQVIWDDGDNTCGNPCVVVDHKTKMIWLLMTHNLGIDREPEIIAQTSQGTRTVWASYSADDGNSWSNPKEITADVKKKEWTWYATGPGNGIQLQSGRLVIPCDHIEAESGGYYSHVIYSDDNGESWHLGGSTPQDQVNECQVVELDDGRLLLNMRNYDRQQEARMISTSADGGLTWSAIRPDSQLIEPICQASLIRLQAEQAEKKSLLLFSNPAHRQERIRMTVRLSPNEGESWPFATELTSGPSAYSSLAVLSDGRIGCLFETGVDSPYERIVLTRLALYELTNE